MRIPEKRLCDLCQAELTGPHVLLRYPVGPADAKLLLDSYPGTGGWLAALAMPPHWPFEFCCGCVDGFMPMLDELKTQMLQRLVEKQKTEAEAKFGKVDES